MLTLEDLFVANQAARQRLVPVEQLREVMTHAMRHPDRVQLVRVLHEHMGIALEQAKPLHDAALRYQRQRSEERAHAILRQEGWIEAGSLEALIREQAAAAYAWSLPDRLVQEQRLDPDRRQALVAEVIRQLSEEDRHLLQKNAINHFAPILGPIPTPAQPDVSVNSSQSGKLPGFQAVEPARGPVATPDPTPAVPTPAVPSVGFTRPDFQAPTIGPDLERATIRMSGGNVLPIPGQTGPQNGDSDGEVTMQLDAPQAPAGPTAFDPTIKLNPQEVAEAAAAANAEPSGNPFATLAGANPDGTGPGMGGMTTMRSGGLGVAPGQVVGGQYRVEKEVGRGAMGVVFKALAPTRTKPVALKVVQGAGTAEVAGRFRREILVSQRIRHSHVIEVYDSGEVGDGTSYMVMEYLEGQSLSGILIREGAQPLPRALLLLRQLLEGLEAVHDNKIVHRDLKPENLQVLTRHGQDHIKIMDFGISRFLEDDPGVDEKLFVTMKGKLSGTPQYVAPEAVLDPDLILPAHDVYAVGVIFYELLTGVLPFPPARTLRDMLQDTVHSRARPLNEANPERAPYPDALQRFVRRLLEKDPELRPKDAGAAIALLDEAEAELRGEKRRDETAKMSITTRILRSITGLFRRSKIDE